MEQRIVDLEVRLAFLERYLEELDSVVRQVRDQLDRVEAELEEQRRAAPTWPGAPDGVLPE